MRPGERVVRPLKDAVRNSAMFAAWQSRQQQRDLRRWDGTRPPPPLFKRQLLAAFAHTHGLSTLVETGTYRGDTAYYLRDRFQRIVTIELDRDLWERAAKRLHRYPHVRVLRGDSAHLMPRVLAGLRGPTLFWLDAHYSGAGTAKGETDSPILRELRGIARDLPAGSVILIDDARAFDGKDGYPTLDQTAELTRERFPGYEMAVKHDIIRIAPK